MPDKIKKLPEDETKQESLLYRLWSRATAREKKTPPPPAAEQEAVETPEYEELYEELFGKKAEQKEELKSDDPIAELRRRSGIAPASLPELQNAKEEAQVPLVREELQQRANEIIARLDAAGEAEDAAVWIKIADDGMIAWLYLFSPQNGGADITEEGLLTAMREAGVHYGFDPEEIGRIARQKCYFQLFLAARGKAAVNGKNGELVDCVARESTITVNRGEDGSVNYENVTAYHNVKQGDVIGNIIPPTEGEDGINVRGEKVRARHGRPADLPLGGNFSLSPDGKSLIAAIDGQVSFRNNKFILERLLVIDGDVDLSVGNLNFDGDIVIGGDVRDGYHVEATGNITIRGMVEDAFVCAGGNICLEKGMNGNGSGSLDAQGEIRSKFLENCVVRSSGNVYAGSIIWCTVSCDDSVIVTSEKGAIIGGTCTAANCVEANSIGSRSNRPTTIVIGNTPNMVEQRRVLEEKLEKLEAEHEEVAKNVAYLERYYDSLPEDRRALLSQLRLKNPVLQMKKTRLQKKLDDLCQSMMDVSQGRIICGTLYPFTKIQFGAAFMMTEEIYQGCTVRADKDKIFILQ